MNKFLISVLVLAFSIVGAHGTADCWAEYRHVLYLLQEKRLSEALATCEDILLDESAPIQIQCAVLAIRQAILVQLPAS